MFNTVKRSLRACFDWIPLTARGAVSIVVAGVALRYLALQEHDRLLLAACVGGLFVIAVMALAVLATGLWLRFRNLPVPDRIDAMESVQCETGLTLPLLASIPCVVVNIRWLNCDGVLVDLSRGRDGCQETIRASQRMQRSEIVRQFEVGDVFGLSSVKFCRTFAQAVRVEPMPAAGCSIAQVRRDQQGDDLVHPNGKPHGDLIEMRHYRPGDPLKLVLWKHYARTRQLLVRQPENSIASMSQTIACFVAGPGDQASAGVARTIVTELKQAGEEILFQADGSAAATDSSAEAIEQIILSADARKSGGGIVAGIGSTIQDHVIKHCVAFVPSQPGAWIDRVVAGQTASQLQIDAIIGVDEPAPPRRHRFFPSWAFHRDPGDMIQLQQVQAVVDRLSAAGISTRIIHRRSGQAWSTAGYRGEVA